MIYTNRTAYMVVYICFQIHRFISHSHIPFKNDKYCRLGACLYSLFFLPINFILLYTLPYDDPINSFNGSIIFFPEVPHNRVKNSSLNLLHWISVI